MRGVSEFEAPVRMSVARIPGNRTAYRGTIYPNILYEGSLGV